MSKKVSINGYYLIYKPEHHKAWKNGCVYEHILVAEEMLGRDLTDEEVVHHIDRDRTNNSLENLIVFATKADHTRYHAGGELIKEGDHYISVPTKEMIISKVNAHKKVDLLYVKKTFPELVHTCKICGKDTLTIYCSNKCQRLDVDHGRKFNPSKEELLDDLINLYTMIEISKKYNVTDNTIRKRLKLYDLPYKKEDIIKLKQKFNTYMPSKSELHREKMKNSPYDVHILTKEEIEYIKENYISGDKEFGARALGKKFNVSHTTIIKHLKE